MRGPQAPVSERLRERLQLLDLDLEALDLDLEAVFLRDFVREADFLLREALLRDLVAGMVFTFEVLFKTRQT